MFKMSKQLQKNVKDWGEGVGSVWGVKCVATNAALNSRDRMKPHLEEIMNRDIKEADHCACHIGIAMIYL